jgi:glutamine synthetase
LSIDEIKKLIKQNNLAMIGVTYVDLAGVARMKPTVSEQIDAVLERGVKTARANYALNTLDLLTPGSSIDISQGDLAIVPDPDTFAIPNYVSGVGRFIGDLHEKDGRVSELCTRNVLKRVLARTKTKGYRFVVGFESEFHLVSRQDGRLQPADMTPVHSQDGYNLHHLLIADIVSAAKSMGIRPTKAHIEGGHAQLEVDVAYEDALRTADEIVYFKDAVRTTVRNHGLLGSFMPKIGHDWWGSGMHMHMSLWNKQEDTNLFETTSKKDPAGLGLSQTCYYFIGGVLKHLGGLSAICAPTFNSYKRILPGRWNADAMTYGAGARGAAVRIPDERGKATRIECRFPDASSNPYLAIACILAAGLEGIEEKITPGDPMTFDASFLNDSEIRRKGLKLMPRSLSEAVAYFEADRLLRDTLGGALSDEFVKAKIFEISQAADKVTQWEVEHYLDHF